MTNNNLLRTWTIVYPILMYYMISNVVMYAVSFILGYTAAEFKTNYMMLQALSALLGILVIYYYYSQDKRFNTIFTHRMAIGFSEQNLQKKITNACVMFLTGALLGFVLNNLIGATGMVQYSANYQNVTYQFFAGGIFFEILGAGILVPVVEELLYRGVVYGRLADWIGVKRAMVISSLIFGITHFNLVQFIYALLIGLVLVLFVEKSSHLYGAIAGHMGANLLTIIRSETETFSWMEENIQIYWGMTVAMALVCILIIRKYLMTVG